MNAPSTGQPSPDYPFPEPDSPSAATTSAREQLADAAARAQERAEAFRDTASGYIRCYPFRAVLVSATLGVLAGVLAARLRR